VPWVVLVGYSDSVDRFSSATRGNGLGEKGYCEMPYLYVTSASLASGFWVVRLTMPELLVGSMGTSSRSWYTCT